jgi:hypothetical protein
VISVLLLISTIVVSASSITNLPFVEAAASISLSPTYAGKGAVVTITGSGFKFSNATTLTSCHLYSLDGASVAGTLVTSPICTVTTAGAVSGSFVVNAALATITNPYTVIVNATNAAGNYMKAQKTFTVTAIKITPASAAKGSIVNVTGSISSTATTCTISGSPVSKPSCSVTGGKFSGGFLVNNVGPGPYTITVTGGGVSVQGTFTVSATTPTIKLYPPLGFPGRTVLAMQNFTGAVLFPTTDTSCSISGTGGVVTSGTCTMTTTVTTDPTTTGSNATGTFKVGNVAAGAYSVTITGSPSGLKASAIFTVTTPFVPTIVVTPSDGPARTVVTVSGTGFSTSDTSCQLTSTDPLLITSPSCSVSGGKLTGKFTVGTGASAGTKTVTATGSTGDSASVNFIVDSFPIIYFYKAGFPSTHISSGYPGDAVSVNVTVGTQFSSGDTSCTISSSPTGLFKSSICVIHGGRLNGTYFVVAGGANGAYAVTVKGNLGDTATAVFTVNILPSLVLTPSSGPTGTVVTFRATGFSVTDTGCTVQSGDGSTNPPTLNMLLITSPACAITSPQVATGSFKVGPTATTNVKWNVTVKGTPTNDEGWHTLIGESALFNVTAQITVVPTTGTNGTVVSVSGSGFSSLATSCDLTVVPNNTFIHANCGVAGTSGQVSGSFIVYKAPPGVYLFKVTDSEGYFAGATFTVGSPTATIYITPNVATNDQTVGVSGFGYNPSDTSCEVTSDSGGTLFASTPSCSVSGGVVAASFKIAPAGTAIPGYYVIVLTAQPYGDFASNYLFVAVITGTLTTSTSTTTSVTTTTATSITTSTPVTLTTTTFTNTGVSTDRSVTLTTTTITGQSTYSISTTSTSTSIITSSTSTTVSTMITTSVIYGQVVSPQLTNSSTVDGNLFGLISMMTLLGWVLVRRWAF